ncbi:trypsin-like serine protease [Aspergillus aculeatinus CBS 121060]|uniref:Trypsin-like serine protease n=1 Tax=Aspergillus aculeatinus CBS 121060 TaxID=1448322 RepID=A0ACD1GTL4_9EURO|nr:trypsin-like serine protease [Aspergillus aculeatinus CBS 121060]RAH64706.1 trypsin-like serine protease [Aspergillus aculeatinus CBS 121060]
MPVVAATWTLQSTPSQAAESCFGLQQEGGESVFEDERQLVDPMHLAPGGKYRSIVKLFMHYAGQSPNDTRYAMGTGWLIRDDLLVTAGHCAFDWKEGFGRANEVKAYIGYNGKGSIDSPSANVQFRHGVRIVTTEGWLQSSSNRHNDVAFIQLDRPFTAVTPFQFSDTPVAGSDSIGVVGYPGDMRYKGEPGAQMYEEFKAVQWNRRAAANHMLEYRIDTYKGQSGSPVLLENQPHISIGAHVYGDVGNNSASPISNSSPSTADNLLLGNPYTDYISVFESSQAYPVQRSDPQTGIQYLLVDRLGQRQTRTAEENFWDDLKDVLHVGAPIVSGALTTVSPFLGPIGGSVAALAGTAISAAAQKCAESGFVDSTPTTTTLVSGSGPSTTLSGGSPSPGSAQESILAEAALQAFLRADAEKMKELGISTKIMVEYQKAAADAEAVAPRLLPAVVMPAALQVVQDVLAGTSTESAMVTFGTASATKVSALRSTTATSSSSMASFTATMAGEDRGLSADPFTTRLVRAAQQSPGDESFWSTFSTVLSAASHGVGAVQTGLSVVSQLIPYTKAKGAESAFDSLVEEETPMDQQMKTLGRRALLAGATLRVLRDLPSSQLDQLEQLPLPVSVLQQQSAQPHGLVDVTGAEEESFFTAIQSAVQKIGPSVMKYAPVVVSAVRPVITALAAPKLQQQQAETMVTAFGNGESSYASSSSRGSNGLVVPHVVRKKTSQSFYDKVMGASPTNGVSVRTVVV